MPTRAPVRRADRRVQEFTGRITAAASDRDRVDAVTGWIKAEFQKLPPARRDHWLTRIRDLAQAMNDETRKDTRDDSQ